MKTLFTISLIILFFRLNAQYDAGNFYLYFWHPNFYNPSAQSSDSLIVVNSISSWEKSEKNGFLNLTGGVSMPFPKNKMTVGVNFFSFHKFYYNVQELGLFFNKKLNLRKNLSFALGGEIAMRSQSFFVKEDEVLPNGFNLQKGYYGKSTLQFNAGMEIGWKNLNIGVSCRNCFGTGYTPNFDGFFYFSTIYGHLKPYFYLNYFYRLKKDVTVRIDAILNGDYFDYFSDFKGSLSIFFSDKFYFGYSMRNDFPVDAAFHFGYKWKNFWLLGVLPTQTTDTTVPLLNWLLNYRFPKTIK